MPQKIPGNDNRKNTPGKFPVPTGSYPWFQSQSKNLSSSHISTLIYPTGSPTYSLLSKMDKYRETLRAMRGGIKKSGSYKGETVWESMGVDRMWGGKNVVWAADCRGFLTKIHEPIYADYGKPKSRFARLAVIKRGLQSGLSRSDMAPRPTKAKIPLVHFEEALRKHVLISPNHTLLERFIAYIPILRYYVLAKRGILYSRSSVKHHARVSEWCRDMRELADEHSAVPQKEGPVPIGEGSGARGSGAPKSQRDLVFGSRSFETVAFPVVLLSLVNKSRHRGVRDFVMVGLSATIIWGIVSGLLIVAGDQYLAAKVWVYMSARSWLGYSHGTEDLVEYLCWEFGTEAWYRAPPSAELLEGKTIPEGFPKVLEEVVDGKVIVHGCTLQHPGTGHMVSVVPLARTGVESHYWWAGERLKRCAAVGLFMYPKEAGPAEVSENLFLPMKYPNLMSVGVFERFLPIYHGAPPHPKV